MARTTKVMTLSWMMLMALNHRVESYPAGAPDQTCSSLMPQHGQGTPNGTSPYQITVSSSNYNMGQEITVTLSSSSGAQFRGFIIQARRVADNSVAGSFRTTSTDVRLACASLNNATVTHTSRTDKSMVTAIWKAPTDMNFGDIRFQATVVQTFSVVYSNLASSVITSNSTLPVLPMTGVDVNSTTCKSSKSCMRRPEGCTDNCQFLATWKDNGNRIDYELSATANAGSRWVALGLSKDQKMGADTVIDCIHDPSIDRVVVKTSLNVNENPPNKAFDDGGRLLLQNSTSGGYSNGRLFCRFSLLKGQTTRAKRQATSPTFFYPNTESYYLLLATGLASSGDKMYHGPDKTSSSSTVDFTSTNFVDISGAGADRLVKAHGIIMIVAWMIFASFGVILPKYYKTTWSGVKWCGKDVWFQLHQPSMIITLLLTIAGFIIIFVKVNGYSNLKSPTEAHPPIGIIVMILALANPIMAIFRCTPDNSRRPIFNVFHSIVGYLAHFGSIVAMLLGLYMAQIGLPDWCKWVFIAFICWIIFSEVVLKVHQHCLMVRHRSWSPDSNDNQFSVEPMKKTDFGDDNVFKTLWLILHSNVILGLAIVIAVQIGKS